MDLKLKTNNHNTVRWIRSDGGREYAGSDLQKGLKRRSMMHEVITAYFPHSNGKAERLNRELLEMARTMLLSVKDC